MKILKQEYVKTILFVLIMMPLLTACGTTRFDTSKSTELILPPLITYDNLFRQMALKEIQKNNSPYLIELAKDYKLTRDKIREAKKSLNP